MLTLSRKLNQKIIIRTANGEEIKIQVCAVRGRTVRIGLEAPQEVSIKREEIAT